MNHLGVDWNEAGESEWPAVELLQQLGYTFVPPETIDLERDSLHEGVLIPRLTAALKRLNPWLSDDNLSKAVRTVTQVQATSLLEASEMLHIVLTCGKSLDQDVGAGKKGQTVQYIDFDDLSQNEFIVTRQFRVQGTKKQIVPDLVLFVNGIPLVILECKSPILGDKWFSEAVKQLLRYQEHGDGVLGLGAPRLFNSIQLLIVTCGQKAFYGTVTTPQRYYAEWKSPWPLSPEQLEQRLGRAPTAQDTLLCGMLPPAHLLDILRNFVVFERDEKSGRTIRKVCRYQQFSAVNKAVLRVRDARKPAHRGGVVWHTQGSGKSLTMLWLALKLRRDPRNENPSLVVVTDRRDLDEQIERTFLACGFPSPTRATNVHHLRELLTGPSGQTVLTTVQKFQELSKGKADTTDNQRKKASSVHPILTEASNLFVLVDEAHRTQYGGLAANMRQALKNAAFFAFTGTPIDKKDRHTLQEFGPYIDTYTIEQAVEDKATVPILYESRLARLEVTGGRLDAVFDRVFADRSLAEREAIKARYGTLAAVAAAPRRIEEICLDLIEHYTQFIAPAGFKAQVVACTREAAVMYKVTLDRLNAPASAIVISSTAKDDALYSPHHSTDEQRKDIVRRFSQQDDPLKILVVCDMLLTGFDAPVEQVMYLDSPLKEHTLLQAIARVNRPADKKEYGLVVDYWGVSKDLSQALKIFKVGDIRNAMTPKADVLPLLQARHGAVLAIFGKVKDKSDLNACVMVLEPEDIRANFDEAFRCFSQSLDILLPDPAALRYLDDLSWLGKIRQAAKARYQDPALDVSDCAAKVRKVIDDAIHAEGVEILVKEVSIYSAEFDEKLNAIGSPDARASEMEHAVRKEVHLKLEEDPVFYTSLKERLEQILAEYKANRIDAAKRMEQLKLLTNEVRNRSSIAESHGLSGNAFAVYNLLGGGPEAEAPTDPAREPRALAKSIELKLDPLTVIVDWNQKEDVQREMRSQVKHLLIKAGYATDEARFLAERVVELLRTRATT